jgi:uncharacterized protein
VSNRLPSREQALQFLLESRCHPKVVRHCKAVAELALKTADILKKKDMKIDCHLVEIGALLHDVGRSKTHTVHHAVVGAELAKAAGLPEPVISIIRRHVGGGITTSEAEELGWPRDNYMPISIEERIVSYADKLIVDSKEASVEITIQKLIKENKKEAASRVRKVYEDIQNLIGDDP